MFKKKKMFYDQTENPNIYNTNTERRPNRMVMHNLSSITHDI